MDYTSSLDFPGGVSVPCRCIKSACIEYGNLKKGGKPSEINKKSDTLVFGNPVTNAATKRILYKNRILRSRPRFQRRRRHI